MTLRRKLYRVEFSTFTRKWVVINDITGVAQSSWDERVEANRVASHLSKVAA